LVPTKQSVVNPKPETRNEASNASLLFFLPTNPYRPIMPKYLIEREVPNAGDMSAEDLRVISQTSCSVLQEMGPQIQWQQSFVAGDKIYCVYIAPNEDAIREHAEKGGFPANTVTKVDAVIDPTTAEEVAA